MRRVIVALVVVALALWLGSLRDDGPAPADGQGARPHGWVTAAADA